MKRANALITIAALALAALRPAHAEAANNKTASTAAKYQQAMRQGAGAMGRMDYGAAISAFDKATRANSSSAEAFFRLADAYYHRAFEQGSAASDAEDASQAIASYETASALDPMLKSVSDPYMFHHGMAMCENALRKYPEALGELRKAMAVSPGNPMPPLYAAQIRLRMNDIPLSTANLNLSIQKARKLDNYPALAKLLRTNPIFNDLMSVPQNRALLAAYDDAQEGKITEAQAVDRVQEMSTYRDSIANTPTKLGQRPSFETPEQDPQVLEHLNRGHEEFRYRHFQNAVAEYEAALDADRNKGTLDAAQQSLLYENLGTSYRVLGRQDDAIRMLEGAVRALPQNSSAFYQLALSYAATGQGSKAIWALDKAFRTTRTMAELRKTLLLAKTDVEFDPYRESPAFQRLLIPNQDRVRLSSAR